MTTAPTTWTFVFVPAPPSGDARPAPLAERIATRAALLLLAWAEHRRVSVRRSVSLGRVAPISAAQRPFC